MNPDKQMNIGSEPLSGSTQTKDFEQRTNQLAKDAEAPDGRVQELALHHDQGKEGAGSKADQALGGMIHQVNASSQPVSHNTQTKDFEQRTNLLAKDAEAPDGRVQELALHHDQGKEGAGSKADEALRGMIHQAGKQ